MAGLLNMGQLQLIGICDMRLLSYMLAWVLESLVLCLFDNKTKFRALVLLDSCFQPAEALGNVSL